jgi:hypothetical protein
VTAMKNIDTRFVGAIDDDMLEVIEDFIDTCKPVDALPVLLFRDQATGAVFAEIHMAASDLVAAATVDVPLDPDEQGDYRANRAVVEDHAAFGKMKEDAKQARTFSNLVGEFTRAYDEDAPLKVIGGQHRLTAIKEALGAGVDEHHGVKVYFSLDNEQRLDVQLISNTNIEVSADLFDRMTETVAGPGLRNWCQAVGLLATSQDFADRLVRGGPITVRAARTFIMNYYKGNEIDSKDFDVVATTPMALRSGVQSDDWEALKAARPNLWKDKALLEAGREFANLVAAQRASFSNADGKVRAGQSDFAEKALNFAVLSGWAFVAGVLEKNKPRLKAHFELRESKSKDPLNAAALAKGRHKTDAENYRGLGYRTDAKERGRFAELFFLQAVDGSKITSPKIDLAIKKHVAKEAALEVSEAAKK